MDIDKILIKAEALYLNKIIRFGICGIYVLLVLVHNFCLRGLEKPAKLGEAFKFLFTKPADYMGAFFCGLIAYPIPYIAVICFILAIIANKCNVREDYYYYDNRDSTGKKIDVWEYIVSIVFIVCMFITNHIYINYVLLLGLALAIFLFIGYCIVTSKNK